MNEAKTEWPLYEALDHNGAPYLRPAAVVHELPSPIMRREALRRIQQVIEAAVGLNLCVPALMFGIPLMDHFGLARREANAHPAHQLLLAQCADLPLTLIVPFK